MVAQTARRLGVGLDCARHMERTDLRLMLRCSKVLGFLDPNWHVPIKVHKVARPRGAVAADCGTCVAAGMS